MHTPSVRRRGRAAGLVACLVLAACAGHRGPSASVAAPRAADDSCPYRTPEEWQVFLERSAREVKWEETCENGPCDADRYHLVEAGIQSVFERCAGFLTRHATIASCAENLRNFTPAWMEQHSPDSYGFTVDNETYLAAQETADKPEGMMRPPAALVAALPRRSRVEAAARANGWQYLTHDSALGGVRTFVLIPDRDGRFDQWLLLNFTGKAEPAIDPDTPMSFLAVQKKDRDGRVLPRVRLHFRDYTPLRAGGDYRLSLKETNNGKCYACHVSGTRQLIPRRTPTLEARPVKGDRDYHGGEGGGPRDFAYGRLVELNARIRSYGLPDWDGRVVPGHHGPPLGEAQGCTTCHDGQDRGVLTVSTSTSQLERKLSEEASMPPERGLRELVERDEMRDPALSPSEQAILDEALAAHEDLERELLASRAPTLRRWLLAVTCR